MKTFKRFALGLLFTLLASQALAQWQVGLNEIPIGRGGGNQGFSIVANRGTAGTQCIIDTVPPSFGLCSTSNTEIVFETLTAAAAANISATPKIVRTLGRNTAGDNGAGSYIRIGASTPAPFRFQSLDGQWWVLNNRIWTPEQFGCFTANDCTAAFASMALALRTASSGGIAPGGIIVNFLPGADYKIWPAPTVPTIAFDLSGASGITFNFNGARLSTNNTFSSGVNGVIFNMSNSSGLIFNGPQYVCTSCSGAIDPINYGLFFFLQDSSVTGYSYNIEINNAVQTWGSAFVLANGNPDFSQRNTAHNIRITNAELTNVFYGLSFQATGDNVIARNIKCTNCGRPYFPYGVNNHDVEIIRNGGGSGFVSILLTNYGQPKADEIRRCTCNLRVYVRNNMETIPTAQLASINFQQGVAPVTVSAAANNGSGAIRLTVSSTASMLTGQLWHAEATSGSTNATGNWTITVIDGTHVDLQGSTFAATSAGYMRVPATIRDIKIYAEMSAAFAEQMVLTTGKFNSDSTVDTAVDGYTMENVSVSGSVRGWNYGVPVMSLFLNNAYSVGTWAGETIRNFVVRDFVASGTSGSVLIDATNVQNLVLENIYTPATIPWTITGPSAQLRVQNVTATGVTDARTVVPSTAGAGQVATGISTQGVIQYGSPFPTPVRAGDVAYWNGAAWTTLAGNNSGTNCFQENSSGVPSWAACGGGGTPGGSSGQTQYNNAGAFGGYTMGGDATINTGTGVLTLKNTGPGATGPLGSATVAPIVTIDAQGRVTALSSATIAPAVGSVTGMAAGCNTWLGTATSANLRACLTDETGLGFAVFSDGPTFTGTIQGAALNLSGNLSASGTNYSFGPGGTGTANVAYIFDGGSAIGGGVQFTFRRNGVNNWAIAHASAVIGAATNDLLIYGFGVPGVAYKFLYADNAMQILGTTAATSSATGILQVSGGVGVAGALWAGTYINITPTVVNSLPGCVAGIDGARSYVTNNNTAAAFQGAVTTGGAGRGPVYCDGNATAWKQG